IIDLAAKRSWELLAVHVRTNHVHVVVRAPAMPIARVMNALKAVASMRLNTAFPHESGRKHWTRHGSTRFIFAVDQVAEKVAYTLQGQGEPMQRFPEPPT